MATALITFLAPVKPLAPRSREDVLALALGSQHERTLLDNLSAGIVMRGMVHVSATYPRSAGLAEVEDAARRMVNATGGDSLKITYHD